MTVKKLEDGRYLSDVSASFDPITGKRRRVRKIFDTKKEAEEYDAKQTQTYIAKKPLAITKSPLQQ